MRRDAGRSLIQKLVLAAAILSMTVGGFASCQKKGGDLRIGIYGSKTGQTATFGISTENGAMMAINEANGAGGIGGLQIRATSEDDQGRPEEAATAVNKLVSQDQVIAVIGEVASSNSLAGAPICQNAGVPMISPSSTNEKVTEIGDFIFRVCFIDPFQGAVAAKFASQSLRATRVAILWDVKSDYSKGLTQVFSATFQQLGGTITSNESYQQGDQDFRAPLTAIIATKPEALYVPGYYTDVGLIARQARELGLTAPLIGGDGWDSPKLVEIGGKALEGCYFSNHYAADDQSPVVQNFIAQYKTKYGETPDALAALGFDAAGILIQSLTKLQKTRPDFFAGLASAGMDAKSREKRAGAERALRNAIAETRDYPGVTGSITIDARRNAVKSAVVLTIRDGKFVFVERVSP
jgi:branched-chain amino acid transport system substrate-binding protein